MAGAAVGHDADGGSAAQERAAPGVVDVGEEDKVAHAEGIKVIFRCGGCVGGHDGELIAAGSRINWNGQLKRAAVDLWDTAENTPDAAPALWEDIAYRAGYRIAPDNFTAASAASKGERLWFGDLLYESLIDGNVYTPEAYPAGWKQVEE